MQLLVTENRYVVGDRGGWWLGRVRREGLHYLAVMVS